MTAHALQSRSTSESSSLYRMLRARTDELEGRLKDHALSRSIYQGRLGRRAYGLLITALLPVREALHDGLTEGFGELVELHSPLDRSARCTKALSTEAQVLEHEFPGLRPVPAARQLADAVRVDFDHLPFLIGRGFALERLHKLYRRKSTNLGQLLSLPTGDGLALAGDATSAQPTVELAECVDSLPILQIHRSDVMTSATDTFEELVRVYDQLPWG